MEYTRYSTQEQTTQINKNYDKDRVKIYTNLDLHSNLNKRELFVLYSEKQTISMTLF